MTERDQAAREARRTSVKSTVSIPSPGLGAGLRDRDQNRAASRRPRGRGSAQAKIEAAEAALRFARATLENTYIRAPFTGTVLRKEAEVGEVVAPSVGGGLTRARW